MASKGSSASASSSARIAVRRSLDGLNLFVDFHRAPVKSRRRAVFFPAHSRSAGHLRVQAPELLAAGCFVLPQLLDSSRGDLARACSTVRRAKFRSLPNLRMLSMTAASIAGAPTDFVSQVFQPRCWAL